jgi:hypothetical protein
MRNAPHNGICQDCGASGKGVRFRIIGTWKSKTCTKCETLKSQGLFEEYKEMRKLRELKPVFMNWNLNTVHIGNGQLWMV